MTVNGAEGVREKALADYRKKLIEHKEIESRLKDSKLQYEFAESLDYSLILIFFSTFSVREQLKHVTKQYDKSENDLKALQSVGQVSAILFQLFVCQL